MFGQVFLGLYEQQQSEDEGDKKVANIAQENATICSNTME